MGHQLRDVVVPQHVGVREVERVERGQVERVEVQVSEAAVDHQPSQTRIEHLNRRLVARHATRTHAHTHTHSTRVKKG